MIRPAVATTISSLPPLSMRVSTSAIEVELLPLSGANALSKGAIFAKSCGRSSSDRGAPGTKFI